VSALLAQMVERWPFKPMVVGSIPTEGGSIFFDPTEGSNRGFFDHELILVGVVGNISACHADAPGSIPGRGAFDPP
jgi:hypothetical protein